MPNLLPKLSVAIATTVLSGAAIAGCVAQTSTITYDFTVNVTQGSLAGKSYNGTFSYDAAKLKGTGIEELGVAQGLTVCMNYFGRNYSEREDSGYPTFPKLVFDNGNIKQLDFWIQPGKRVVWWNLPGWEVKLSKRQAAASDATNCQNRAL